MCRSTRLDLGTTREFQTSSNSMARVTLAGPAHRVLQQLELTRQQLEVAASPGRAARDQVQLQRPHAQQRLARVRGPAQKSLHPGGELLQGERLGQG